MTNAIIFIYLAAVLIIGMLAGRGIKNISQYAVAGKSYGSMVIFATLSASFIGGGFSMGNAEKVFLLGIVNIVALWGFSLKEVLVAKYIAPRMDRYRDAISVGDIMKSHYGVSAKVFSGIFGFILCAGILGAQIGAIGYVTNLFLGIERFWGIMLGCGIVITYATVGGMRAVVWTDIVQFVILAFGLPLTLYFGIQSAGGIEHIVNTVPSGHLSLPVEPLALIALASLFLTFVFGETLVPPYLQRLLIGRDAREVSKGTLYSGLFSFPFFAVTGLIGIVALVLNPEINPNLAMPFVIQQALPPILQGIVIAAVIAIIMSSADSFLNAAAICFSNDIVKPLKKEAMSHKSEVLMARLVTLMVGVLAVIFALSIESILDILIYSYNFWAPIILVPLVMAVMQKKVSQKKFLVGAGAGIFSLLIWNYGLGSPLGIHGIVVGVFANYTGFVLADNSESSS
ncbi:sodium:solute symporter family protein [Desulfonatronovibrio magnus]|uniref:sodium:solute symporter family protein n=1 Tax=Desulfonatronovibrio magnus TaxID=698827 RepID=UPI0005EBDEC6|nr:sodium:solute symporter family protein [Desulfonatronovibrio magnus]